MYLGTDTEKDGKRENVKKYVHDFKLLDAMKWMFAQQKILIYKMFAWCWYVQKWDKYDRSVNADAHLSLFMTVIN